MNPEDLLDNAVWWSLTGPHEELALGWGGARRYPPDIAPFAALPDRPGADAWADLAAVAASPGLEGTDLVLFRSPVELPAGWREGWGGTGVQMVWRAGPLDATDPDAVDLGPGDTTEVLDLVARTRPGPFAERTLSLGRYAGLRDPATGDLVAMAGERLRPEGACEVSAVCTDPKWRGRGLAGRLVRHLVTGITGRGELPFLHAASDNTSAIRLYEALGFEHRRQVRFVRVQPAIS